MPEWEHPGLKLALQKKGRIPFVEFSRLALYDPEHGYYRQDRKRVGATQQADFQTNLAVRSVFGPLVVEAIRSLLGEADLGEFTFVEVAAEPETSLLSGEDHPFGSSQVVRLGEEVPELTGPTVLFANEWLDAQPFVRLIFEGGEWKEVFVGQAEDESLCEIFSRPESEDALKLSEVLPEVAPEGYRLDLSVEADSVLERYLRSEWKGIFLTLDYGSFLEALVKNLPGGTGRAYFRHQQIANLLAQPGHQDLTCNVCWDRVISVLERNGFQAGGPQRQEAFFMEKASRAIQGIVEGGASPEAASHRARLMQLLNPVHLGAAFQAVWGIR